MTSTKTKNWHALHYNAVAKEIRDELAKALGFYGNYDPTKIVKEGRAPYYAVEALVRLALRFAKRFNDDFERASEGLVFDPLKWLDQCSPDPEMYPLSELWEDYVQ